MDHSNVYIQCLTLPIHCIFISLGMLHNGIQMGICDIFFLFTLKIRPPVA